MIVDARQLDQGEALSADNCIVGGGAAGIALAISLAERGFEVVLLEGGGLMPDPLTQQLYAGENHGLARELLQETRSRYLGGSTNCWGGWCRPLDDIDFEERPWISDSGWPITKATLLPYYAKSHEWLQLANQGYGLGEWADSIAQRQSALLPIDGTGLQNVLSQLSPPTRFGTQYRTKLNALPNLKVLLFANATEIVTDETGTHVSSIKVATLNAKRFSVRAKYFTLACGGIENARLLLMSNKVRTAGVGNQHDVVGRYYSDHPRVKSHWLRIADAKRYRALYDATLHRIHTGRGRVQRDIEVHLAPTFDLQRQQGLSNSRTYFVARHSNDLTKSFLALKALQRAISGRSHFGYPRSRVVRDVVSQLPTLLLNAPTTALTVADVRFNSVRTRHDYSLETVFEPVPNRDSRIVLTNSKDALGLPRVSVDWRLTEQDRDNFNRQTQLVIDGLTQAGIIEPVQGDRPGGAVWPDDIMGCWHHMGTTRMSQDPRKGVVDAECRVHGVNNLFIAGSSVFPTVGSDSPTITLVALALRLADRIAAELADMSIQRGREAV